jgi:aromatic-L-amino-acid decarboxylase
VDAAYAGSAMILPEYRWMADGLEYADSYVFNPHKWLFTNFDLSAYYVKDKDVLIRTFAIMPEYLKTRVDQRVNNYRDWGIQLGRRFRALKIWFVLRNFGITELKSRIKKHIGMVQELAGDINKDPDFELIVENPLNMICFRFNPGNTSDENKLNSLNERILQNINATGQTFLTHTRIKGTYVIRLVAGQTYLEKTHLQEVWQLIRKTSYDLLKNE